LGEQPFEVSLSAEASRQLLREHRLRRPRRAEHQNVLSRKDAEQDPIDDRLTLDEGRLEFTTYPIELLLWAHGGKRSRPLSRGRAYEIARQIRARLESRRSITGTCASFRPTETN